MARTSSAGAVAGKGSAVANSPLADEGPEGGGPRRMGRPKEAIRNATFHRRLLMTLSKEYYVEGFTKVQIAERLGISRFKVARCLDEARELGMVSITLNSNRPMSELSDALAKHLGLRGACVVEVYGGANEVRAVVGRSAGTYLRSGLEDGEVLGIGWGRTLNTMFDNVQHLPHVEIVQLSGKFGGDVHNSAAELTRRMAALTRGAVRVIPAPFFFDDARQATAVRRQAGVSLVVDGFNRITTAVVGIGAVLPTPISVAYSAVPERFTERLLQSGGVGEVQGMLFADDGHEVDTRLWGHHTVTITPKQLRKVRRVIAAASDPLKARAVRSVCCSGILTDVVIDVELAMALLRLPPITEASQSDRG